MGDICKIPPEDVEITDVTADSRLAVVGSLFFAVCGVRENGADYITDAVKNGASAVVVPFGELSRFEGSVDVPVVGARDVRSALATAAARLHALGDDGKRIRLVAVTGTNGKTTTAHITAHILSSSGYKTALMGTVGSGFYGNLVFSDGMTTPPPEKFYSQLSNFQKNGTDFLVFEASSQGIAQGRLDGIPYSGALSELAVFTNLSPEHLDYHSSMEDYFEVKKRLFCDFGFEKRLINVKGEYGRRLFGSVGGITLGGSGDDFGIGEVRHNGAIGVSYKLSVFGTEYEVKCPVPGRFTAENTALAIASAVCVGIPPERAVFAVSTFGGVVGRMEKVSEVPTVIIDFAHTPKAMEELLLTVREFALGRRITVLFGCGGDRDKTKRPVMGEIASRLADRVIITSDNSRTESSSDIINDIMKGVPQGTLYTVIPDRGEAIEYAVSTADEDDVIILAGKGHERYEDKDCRKFPFDERERVFEALKKRNGG